MRTNDLFCSRVGTEEGLLFDVADVRNDESLLTHASSRSNFQWLAISVSVPRQPGVKRYAVRRQECFLGSARPNVWFGVSVVADGGVVVVTTCL